MVGGASVSALDLLVTVNPATVECQPMTVCVLRDISDVKRRENKDAQRPATGFRLAPTCAETSPHPETRLQARYPHPETKRPPSLRARASRHPKMPQRHVKDPAVLRCLSIGCCDPPERPLPTSFVGLRRLTEASKLPVLHEGLRGPSRSFPLQPSPILEAPFASGVGVP